MKLPLGAKGWSSGTMLVAGSVLHCWIYHYMMKLIKSVKEWILWLFKSLTRSLSEEILYCRYASFTLLWLPQNHFFKTWHGMRRGPNTSSPSSSSSSSSSYPYRGVMTLRPIIMVQWKMGPCNSSILSFGVGFPFHDCKRKGIWYQPKQCTIKTLQKY